MKKSPELKVAIRAAKEAGKAIMKQLGKVDYVRTKSARLGIVTEADFAAQRKIKQVISKAFPKARFYAEEDKQHFRAENLWIIDPLDGTHNFRRGIRMFSVSIALLKGNELVLGVVFEPNVNELFYAEKGKGAYLNGKRIKVSKNAKASEVVFNVGLPWRAGTRQKNLPMFKKLIGHGSARNLGSAALELAYIASGRMEAMLEYGLFAWDSAAGILLVEEAGGTVSNAKGKPFDIFNQDSLVAANAKIHKKILRLLK
jgi:myo-inositol-1(or 4)-monophosphatase